MIVLNDFSHIFRRYDLALEKTGKPKQVSDDPVLQEIARFVVEGDPDGIVPAVIRALETSPPMEVINNALIPGMNEVSRLWEEGVYFLPQVILSSDAMSAGIAECERKLGKAMARKAKVVTHTAEGDIHDIGQVIVNALLNANGYEVINLGADVPVETVVAACKEHNPVMVTGTALMTTTMTAFPRIAHQLKQAGLIIPFACGGGAVNEEYVTGFDLGIYGKEAGQATGMADDAASGETWQAMRTKWNG
ncbi:MAG: B12-binding domain-containing protein [Pseudomonadota bacterium]